METGREFISVEGLGLTEANIQFLVELNEAINEVNLIKAGEKKARSAEELLGEL